MRFYYHKFVCFAMRTRERSDHSNKPNNSKYSFIHSFNEINLRDIENAHLKHFEMKSTFKQMYYFVSLNQRIPQVWAHKMKCWNGNISMRRGEKDRNRNRARKIWGSKKICGPFKCTSFIHNESVVWVALCLLVGWRSSTSNWTFFRSDYLNNYERKRYHKRSRDRTKRATCNSRYHFLFILSGHLDFEMISK